MLKKTLLATTALVLCASLSLAGQNGGMAKNRTALVKMLNHAAIAHPNMKASQPVHNVAPNLENAIFSNYSKDANAQFVSWYGYTAENWLTYYYCTSDDVCPVQITAENAFAFIPATSVTTKKVTVPLFSYFPSGQFEVDIYSSVGGVPGNVIAHSRKFTDSDTALCCTSSRTVTIKASLTVGTQYFVGAVGVCCNANGGWNMEDTDFSGAAVDYYRYKATYYTQYGSPSCTSSPWHARTTYPTTGAIILK